MRLQEYEHRFAVWLDNLEYVIQHNAKGASYWLGMSPLSDLTQSEFSDRSRGFRADLAAQAKRRQNALGAPPFRYHATSPPKEIDWTKKGAVTKVKNQGQVKLEDMLLITPLKDLNSIIIQELEQVEKDDITDLDML